MPGRFIECSINTFFIQYYFQLQAQGNTYFYTDKRGQGMTWEGDNI